MRWLQLSAVFYVHQIDKFAKRFCNEGNWLIKCPLHARVQEFSSGGGGGGGGGGFQVNMTKKALTFFLFVFFSSCFLYSSAYFTEVKWLTLKKTIIVQGSRGSPTFFKRVQLFPGGGGPIAYSL